MPRPIAWVSSLSAGGVPNLAPFSQFTNVSYDPPHVLFCPRADTDTARNVAETGEFVVNMATYEMRQAVNATSAVVPSHVDEAALAGLEMVPSRLVKPQRVAASPTQLECKLYSIMHVPQRLPDHLCAIVIGRVIGVHIADHALTPEGRIDVSKVRPLARLGYLDYTSIESIFTMSPPDGPNAERSRRGLEGRPDMAVAANAE